MTTMSETKNHKVYVCSALRGDTERNIEKAKCYCRYVVETFGYLPIAPHIYFTQFLNDCIPEEREFGIRAGLLLLSGCDELWYFGDKITGGMTDEINFAMRNNIPVKYIPRYYYDAYLLGKEIDFPQAIENGLPEDSPFFSFASHNQTLL